MSAINKILPVVMLMFIFIIFGTYATGILSNADDNVHISEDYEDQYDNNIGVQKASMSLFTPISMLLGVLILVWAVRTIAKRKIG